MTNAAIAPLLLPARTPRAGRAHQPQAGAAPRRGFSLPEAPITRTTSTVYVALLAGQDRSLWDGEQIAVASLSTPTLMPTRHDPSPTQPRVHRRAQDRATPSDARCGQTT
jgi:hypothetical protein